ncbi:MAG TPA: histidine phosphatase family protein [Roseiflexaceae bacterium]|nr:histidine phosphatase family protein [Roseiflexaceae bacterium]
MLEELYLVRHAAPDRATGLPYNIVPGPPLTPAGHQEAVQAAHWLRGRGVEHVFTSPFTRARATAETIAAALEVGLTVVERLGEGAPGETLAQVRARVCELLPQLEDTPLRRVALVTHGACILGLLQHTTGDSIDLAGHRYDNGNCAPTAGIWRGALLGGAWRWELAFQPDLSPQWV